MTLLTGQRTLNDPTGAKGTYAPLTAGVGVPSSVGGAVGVTVTSVYGMHGDGSVYYDPDGASPGEEAVLVPDPASASGLSFVKIGV